MYNSGPLPELTTSAALRREGEANDRLERAERRNELVRIHRGYYVDAVEWAAERADRQHLLLVEAAQSAARTQLVFSHESAAALLGIPILGRWPRTPHATTSGSPARRSTAAVTWHNRPLDDDVIERHGFLLTSPMRTLLDLFATRDFTSGVISADYVVANHLSGNRSMLADEIERRRPFRNVNRAEASAALATGLSQSPGESLSMVRFWQGGYELPEQQRRWVGSDQQHYFSDFYFRDADAIGESDGHAKYTDPRFLRARSPEKALLDEKHREDELRSQVTGFARWDWDDAWRGQALYRKLARAGIRPASPRRSLPR